ELKEKLRQEQLEAEEERMKLERQRQLQAAQQAQEDEALRRRVEEERARKLRESEKIGPSRLRQESYLRKELDKWQDSGEVRDILQKLGWSTGFGLKFLGVCSPPDLHRWM